MRTTILIIIFFCNCSVVSSQFLCDPADTRVVITGVLRWQDPAVNTFSDENRKDQELFDQLSAVGIPDTCRTLLLDDQGTKERMINQIRRNMRACTENSTFIFYYAGHGSKIGTSYFLCNYDMGDDQSSMFNVETLYDLAAKHFNGKRIVLMADCCYSGSLLAVGKKISDLGKEVLVLTSATSSNISTGNWTFTQTLLDNLRGDAFADANGDGHISVSETSAEIKQAMKFREYQLNGFAAYHLTPENLFISRATPSAEKTSVSGKFGVKQYVYAHSGSKWRTARIIKSSNDNYTCQFYNYSVKENVELGLNDVREVYFPVYEINQKVKVEWEGKYYPAVITALDDAFMYIHYEGYDNSYDEWVMYDRIWTGNEIEMEIEWKGSWYPGYILVTAGDRFFITYKGDAHSWDEWVGKERLR